MRTVAFLVLLAVLPTVELTEQVVHVVEHALAAEVADHAAHHDGSEDEEHGCTSLVHLCGCHHAQVTPALALTVSRAIEANGTLSVTVPDSLVDLTSHEPPHRPPIG
jgi:hypothetical protein